MEKYKPYVFLGKYVVNQNSSNFIEDYVGMMWNRGYTLRTSPYGQSNIRAINYIKELNKENCLPISNQLEVFIPIDNTMKKANMYINTRTFDYELQNIYTRLSVCDSLDYLDLTFTEYINAKNISTQLKPEVIDYIGYNANIMPKNIVMKMACSINMIEDVDIISLYGSDELRRGNGRIDIHVTNKMINMVKILGTVENKEIIELGDSKYNMG